jgi:hypothetical protein
MGPSAFISHASPQNLGIVQEITNVPVGDGHSRRPFECSFIEVNGRRAGAETVTVTRNEILTAVNAAEPFTLTIVEVENGRAKAPHYVRRPFSEEPGSAEVASLIAAADVIATSIISRAETAAALVKAVRVGVLKQAEAGAALEVFREDGSRSPNPLIPATPPSTRARRFGSGRRPSQNGSRT